ncbi:MAG: DNA polymerase III subunit beta [Planctomycetota bacterium]|nr:DNA polymerase III subunit beta [Planctomycetota bacterium]
MKATCDREALREGLAVINSVIPTKSTKPILENVCIVATDDHLELVGTDQEVSVRFKIDRCEVVEPGPVVVPARTAFDFVRDLSGETVTIATGDSQCTITSGADSCDLVIADATEYPVVPRFDDTGATTIQGGNFTRLVGRTAFAAAKEPGRYAMHGVLAELKEDKLRLVATDGRRLSMASIPVEMSGVESARAIVPTKGMQLFCRVIGDPLDQIRFAVREDQVGLASRNAEIFARLIDGDFPQYEAVIPAECGNRIEADSDTFARKLRLVSNVSGDETRAVRLRVKGEQLEFYGQSAGRGEATAHMDVDFKGEDGEIAFNPDYVLDGIKNGAPELVVLEFGQRTSPGKFHLGEEHIYIVMPITLET